MIKLSKPNFKYLLAPKILKSILKGKEIKYVAKHFGVSITTISLILKKNNISILTIKRNKEEALLNKILAESKGGLVSLKQLRKYKITPDKIRSLAKLHSKKIIIGTQFQINKIKGLDRVNEIMNLSNDGVGLLTIGRKFGISKQRVAQILDANNCSRPIDNRHAKIKIILDKILIDWNNHHSLTKIVSEYNISRHKIMYWCEKFGVNEIYTHYSNFNERRLVRNKLIGDIFLKGNTAKTITTLQDDELDNPNRVKTEGRIYSINSTLGIKRYPTIGNRSNGGVFLNKRIINFIKRKLDKGFNYNKITKMLNKNGYKSVTGGIFYPANVSNVYKTYQKNGFGG
jgi:hypothetical protein